MPRNEFIKNGIKWINVSEPDDPDIQYIKSLHDFHPLVVDSITSPTLHPTIEDYENHFFLILHFPIIYRDTSRNVTAEVDFLVIKNTLITITYINYPKLNDFFIKFSDSVEYQNYYGGDNTGKLLYGIIEWLFHSLVDDLDFIEEQITHIEDKIFERKHESIVEEISHVRRDVLDFRRVVSPTQTVIKLLPSLIAKFYGKEIEPYFIDLLTIESKVRHLIENHKETIDALYETNESLVSNQISKIITVLTIFSAIILPVNLIASLWGMNHIKMPLRDGPYDFWIIIGLMIAIALILIAIFKKKKWL